MNSDEYKHEGRKGEETLLGPSEQREQRLGAMKKHAVFKLLVPTSFPKKVKLMQIPRTWGKKSQDLNQIR